MDYKIKSLILSFIIVIIIAVALVFYGPKIIIGAAILSGFSMAVLFVWVLMLAVREKTQ